MTQYVRTPLLDHQAALAERFKEQVRVLVGWDMGTGKTLYGIERDLRIRADDGTTPFRTLVVAPLGTHRSWVAAFAKEAPGLKVQVIDPKRRSLFWDGGKHDVYIMHWQAVRLMWQELEGCFDHGIFDECHAIKNRKTAVTRSTKKLKIPFLTDMSGSAATDRPSDLWSVLHHLKPRTFSSYWKFVDLAVEQEMQTTYIKGRPQQFRKLAGPTKWWVTDGLKIIHPYYDRVELEDVHDLPPIVYRDIYVDLSREQRRNYDEMNEQMIAWVRDELGDLTPMTAPAVIAKLQRLQQFALATMTYSEDTGRYKMSLPSTKVNAVFDVLDDAQDEQFVIFSQFKGPLILLAREMERKGISCVKYTGDESAAVREQNKATFIAGGARCYLATIGASGEGVDGLQGAARQSIFLDRDWSPMRNKQAERRLHRIGQENTVVCTNILAKDTVDFPRGETIEMKRKWVLQTLGATRI